MKSNQLILLSALLCTFTFCFLFSSCDSSSSYVEHPEYVRVSSVEASVNFDLSSRSDWEFYVGSKRYRFEVDGKTLRATPYKTSEPYEFEVSAGNRTGRVPFTLMSVDYGKPRSEISVPISLENQSTPEKFRACDLLKGEYYGDAREELSEIVLFHQNALLLFTLVDIPADAKVNVIQINSQRITPLQDAEDPLSYKAIVFAHNYVGALGISVEVNGKTYAEGLDWEKSREVAYPDGIGTSSVVEFTVHIDEKDKLEFGNVKRTLLVKEWPITD